MSKKLNENQARQGDVLIEKNPNISVEQLRRDGKSEGKGKCILAEGEATGHAHRAIVPPINGEYVEIFQMGNSRIMYVPECFGTVTVNHEEHGPVTVGAGCHDITIQQEYRDGLVRNVRD